ncbi:MAG TPA: hypothetical protein VJ905_04785 [Halalkalibaculum sp.]|nr:hypothetical protein [Halalkalibaculum sp.]
MKSKTHNRIDELARRNTIRLDETERIIDPEESEVKIEDETLNTLRSFENKRTLKGSREKNQQSNKSIAIIKE